MHGKVLWKATILETVDRTIKMFIYSVTGTFKFIIATKFLTCLASVVL